ncbi:MAG: hypothetical protein OEV44_03690 [Spirochaetota bacterium]|nr:hypothetical protein [Spirochaetota bacterium]
MKINIKQCMYPVLQKYLFEGEFIDALKHTLECNDCLNKLVDFDRNLVLANNLKNNDNILYDENEFSILVEKFEKNINNINDSITSQKSVLNFLNFIENKANAENIKTPVFLKNIIKNDLNKNENSELNNVVIKISDGLKVVANYIQNMLIVPNEMIPVAVRSGIKNIQDDMMGSVNFVQILEKNKANYSVIKDSSESVLLTISFENEKNKPEYINLKSNEQTIYSQKLSENYVYFSKIKEGDYCIELKYQSKLDVISVPITII